MANKDFNSIEALLKHLQKEITQTIQQPDTNVENVVKHEFIEAIDDGYDLYDPRQYDRKRKDGGLSDPDNFSVTNVAEGIAMESTRKGIDGNGNQVNVLEVWEGNAPWGIPDKWGYGYDRDRGVIENATDRLKNSKSLKRAFELDLKNRGFKTE